MRDRVMQLMTNSNTAFENLQRDKLPHLTQLDEYVDKDKKLIAGHFDRLAEANCSVDVSPYYSSVLSGLERVADHLVNVGYSIVNPIGSQKEM